jgi:hypothetical protein
VGAAVNPLADVETPPLSRSGDTDVFSPEEVYALVRRGRERAGRRDLPDRGAHRPAPRRAARAAVARRRRRPLHDPRPGHYSEGVSTTPKSGKMRAVPMAPDAASTLARLRDRENWDDVRPSASTAPAEGRFATFVLCETQRLHFRIAPRLRQPGVSYALTARAGVSPSSGASAVEVRPIQG